MSILKNILAITSFVYFGLSAEEVSMSNNQKSSFAVIYRTYIQSGRENEYQYAWEIVAKYFVEQRGAIGSCLHQAADGMWVAYSRWPDEKTRNASWPGSNAPSDELPLEVQQAILTLKDCSDKEKTLPDICMNVVNDLLLDELR